MNKIDPLEYLPEFYRNAGGFTERFLSIFMEVYKNLEDKIDESAKLYDPEICPGEFVEWLGEWLSAENMRHFPDSEKRKFLLMLPELIKKRGTIGGIKKLLELYCGTQVFIVECYHVKRYFPVCRSLERMYGGGRFDVWVLCPPTKNKTEALEEIVSSQFPVGVNARVKLLKSMTELDNYCYLGVNSVLAGTRQGVLDGKSALNYVHFGRADNE